MSRSEKGNLQIVRCKEDQEKLERKQRARSQRALCAVLRRLDSTLTLISLKLGRCLNLDPQMDFSTLLTL